VFLGFEIKNRSMSFSMVLDVDQPLNNSKNCPDGDYGEHDGVPLF
jgi:hypothetical protein